ncbi:MAG TPA: NADPH-dependent FMN reductase [Terriglobales bacterium]|nr:NADPH-dependent FMN reductase [Terriglobales bacterium]
MKRILAISGSLRADSTNARLLRAGALLAPAGVAAFVFYDQQIASVPPFSPDLDRDDVQPPAPVAAFRRLLVEADGILICCPEYAHGVPGAFKNALDWIVSSGEFTDKPTALIMASASGAEQARAALVPTLKVMGAALVSEHSMVMRRNHLDAEGRITDPTMAGIVTEAVTALLKACNWKSD